MAFFRQLIFAVGSEQGRRAACRQAEALAGVTVLLTHARPLGMLERPRLWQPQWEVCMVLEISHRHRTLAPRTQEQGGDPYRASFETFIDGTRPDINELIEALSATHTEVTHGGIRFRTERHTAELCAALGAQIRAACPTGTQVRLEEDLDDATLLTNERALEGRIDGPVLAIKALHRLLRDSPLLPDDAIAVRYRLEIA